MVWAHTEARTTSQSVLATTQRDFDADGPESGFQVRVLGSGFKVRVPSFRVLVVYVWPQEASVNI